MNVEGYNGLSGAMNLEPSEVFAEDMGVSPEILIPQT
jgi:hypothetical protein